MLIKITLGSLFARHGSFDSVRDIVDIGKKYFALESLDNEQNALHLQENLYSGLGIEKII